MKNEYILNNRYGDKVSLKKIDIESFNEKEYYLFIEKDYPYRVIGNDDDIKAVDPSGAPFLSIGIQIEDCVIKKIYRKEGFGIVFCLEEI